MHGHTENNSDLKYSYRPEIDGLRALAVLSVIIYHFGNALLPNGYLGVDIFFVISGYVITSSLANSPSKTITGFLLGFYSKRIKRLVPALLLCVSISSIFICLVNPEPGISLRTGIASLFGLSNIYLYRQAIDYFGASAELNIFTHTWSLGVEEQFYLFFPILVWLTGLGKNSTKSSLRFLLVVAVISFTSMLSFVYFEIMENPSAFYLMPLRLWELGAGCLLFVVLNNAPNFIDRLQLRINSLLVLIVIFLILVIPSQHAAYITVALVFSTALLIASLRPHTSAYSLLTHPRIVYIGLISYSLYLWHWSVLVLSNWTIGINLWTAPVQAALIWLLADISYRLVEKPLRYARWSPHTWKTVFYGFSGSIGSAIFIFSLHSYSNQLLYERDDDLKFPSAFSPLIASDLPFNPTCVVDSQNRPLKANTFDLCTISPKIDGGTMIWALGDSHMGHLNGLLNKVYHLTGTGIHLIEMPGNEFPQDTDKSFSPQEIVYNKIRSNLKKGDIVLISRLFLQRKNLTPAQHLDAWYSKVGNLAEYLSTKEVNLVVIGPPPIFEFEDIQLCRSVLFPMSSNCHIDRNIISKQIVNIHKSLSELAMSHPNIFVFNQFELLCPVDNYRCFPFRGDAAIFRDKDHLNSAGAASLGNEFIKFLRGNNLIKSI